MPKSDNGFERLRTMDHIVIRDEHGVRYGFDGVLCGVDRAGTSFYATQTGKLVIDAGQVDTIEDEQGQSECIIALVGSGDVEVAGALIEALGLDVEVPL